MNKLITSIVPALNEEKNILLTIDNILSAFKEFNLNGEVLIINDGSSDSTAQLVKEKMKENPNFIRMVDHNRRKGMGASFWDGVDSAKGEIVVMIPGDNENDPREILRYYGLLKHVDIVIPFIFNKEVRSFFRNIISSFYLTIVNITFSTNFNYTNGTILYRRSILKELDYRAKGFFFQTDILVRLAKKGYLFAEVPCELGLREEGVTKAITFFSIVQIIKEYLRLVIDYYFRITKKVKIQFSVNSLTAIRRNKNERINT